MPTRMTADSPIKIGACDKKLRALQLRREGKTFAQIAKEMGLSHRYVRELVAEGFAALLDTQHKVAVDVFERTMSNLESLREAVWDEALNGDLDAVKTALAVIDRTTRLLGLEAPSRAETKVLLGATSTAEIASQAARLGLSLEQLRGPEPPLLEAREDVQDAEVIQLGKSETVEASVQTDLAAE